MSSTDADFETPYGCRWCGDDKNHHGHSWHPTAGLHQWEQPTQQQTLDRMRTRRARRNP
jgi:hypothetical protein